jgi:aminopeptidase N
LAALEALPAPAVMAALEAFGVPPGAVLGSAPVLTGDPGPDDLFSIPYVYERGALTMHALRREVGDETFFAILREWAAAYSGGNATVQDFVAHAEAVSGEDLAPLFDAWLFRLELPAFPG